MLRTHLNCVVESVGLFEWNYIILIISCRVTTARFKALATEIGTTFNEDPAIYFNPSTKTKNGGAIQCGKLWEKYNSEKKNLRTAKILSEKKKSASASASTLNSK